MKRRITDEELADELTAIAIAHLSTLPADERERRIQAFERYVPGASNAGCAETGTKDGQ